MTTTKRPNGVIHTTTAAHVSAADMQRWLDTYRKLGGGRVWLFDGMAASTYDVEAARLATVSFPLLMKERGLQFVVVSLASTLVRMGARAVALTSKIDMRFTATSADAEALALTLLAAPRKPERSIPPQ